MLFCEDCSDVDILGLLLNLLTESLDIQYWVVFHLPHHLAGLSLSTSLRKSVGLTL